MATIAGFKDSRQHGPPADIDTFQFPATIMVFEFTFSGTVYYSAIRAGMQGWVPVDTDIDLGTVIQSALDGLTVGRTTPEKIVTTCGGTINARIIVPSNTIWEHLGSEILYLADEVNDRMIVNSERVAGNVNITLDNLYIDGNKTGQSAIGPTYPPGIPNAGCIDFIRVDNLIVRNCHILNAWAAGIETMECTYIRIHGNYIDNSADDGIGINYLCFYVLVENNTCLNSGQVKSHGAPHGIEVQDGSHHVVISGNLCGGNLEDGISVNVHDTFAAVYYVTIVGNIVYDNAIGINILGLADVILHHIVVGDNVVSDNSGYGLRVSYAETVVASDNEVNGNGGVGIRFEFVSFTLISSNQSEENEYGMRLVTCSYTHITSNMVKGNQRHGIEIEENTFRCFIEGNSAINNGTDEAGAQVGIAIHGDNNEVLDNYCIDTRAGAARTQQYGMYIFNTADGNTVRGNRFYNNSLSPFIDDGTNTRIPEIYVYVIDPDTTLGTHPAINLPDGVDTTVRFQIQIPLEFQRMVTAQVIVAQTVTAASPDMQWSTVTNFGKLCADEDYNEHTDAETDQTTAITQNHLECIDVPPSITVIEGGDLVGFEFIRRATQAGDTINGAAYFLGFRLRYV